MKFGDKMSVESAVRIERLMTLRNWCIGVGVVAVALGLIAAANTAGNPKTWSSTFFAFAAIGSFSPYAVVLLGVGGVLLLLSWVLGLVVRVRTK